MSNDLTIAVLDNKSVSVPIGVTVLTNKKRNNSLKVQKVMTGVAVEAPGIGLIEAPGYDGEQAYRNNSDEVYFDTPIDRKSLQISEVSFDDKKGILTFIRKNGQMISSTSFLRQIDFGVGPAGSRGDPGKNGRTGEDGKDGKDGETGCAGPNGNDGRNGPVGDQGLEGDVGADGYVGPLGPTGPRGDRGPTGVPGFEGKRGLCGFSCPTTSRGPCGPVGNTMNKNVATGAFPTNLDLIWAGAEDCVCPVYPNAFTNTPVPNPATYS